MPPYICLKHGPELIEHGIGFKYVSLEKPAPPPWHNGCSLLWEHNLL